MPKSRRRRSLQKQAIREIKKFQGKGKFATKQLIAKSCFRRLVREIATNYNMGLRFREEALDGLQEAAETQIVRLLSNANKVAVAEGRMTLQPKDMQIAKSIMEDSEIKIAVQKRSPTSQEGEDEDENEDGYVLVHPE